jgi:NAD(P)-dependent dehydrogenase (short-subunit alcohol dehydrogenase family)
MVAALAETGFLETMKAKCEVVEIDVASLASVDRFIGRLKSMVITQIDRLILNAGAKDYSNLQKHTTEDGIDEIWQINYFSNFYLVCALAPILRATPGSRVVLLSSLMHWLGSSDGIFNLITQGATSGGISLLSTYRNSKFAITVLGSELSRRGIDTVAVNPGGVASEIWRNWYTIYLIGPVIRFFVTLILLTCTGGAQTTLYACRALTEKPRERLVYLSPYGQIKSSWELLAFLSDIHWFRIPHDQSRFIGQCSRRVEDTVLGARLWQKSIDVISKTCA